MPGLAQPPFACDRSSTSRARALDTPGLPGPRRSPVTRKRNWGSGSGRFSEISEGELGLRDSFREQKLQSMAVLEASCQASARRIEADGHPDEVTSADGIEDPADPVPGSDPHLPLVQAGSSSSCPDANMGNTGGVVDQATDPIAGIAVADDLHVPGSRIGCPARLSGRSPRRRRPGRRRPPHPRAGSSCRRCQRRTG